MEPIQISTREAIVWFMLINAVIGLVLGLIPLFIGYLKGKNKYGIIGFITSIAGGAIFGIYLSVPISAVFAWLILENKLPRIIIGSAIMLSGLFAATFGFYRMNEPTSQLLEFSGGRDPISRALVIGGIFFTVIGTVLLILSVWPKAVQANGEKTALDPFN